MQNPYLETRYLAPTNTRGARIRVIFAGSKQQLGVVPFDYALDGGSEQHLAAIKALIHSQLGCEVAYATARGFVVRIFGREDV